MKRGDRLGRHHRLVEHWDDERALGNGIIVTLRPGHYFYDDCGVMGFETPTEARQAVREVVERERNAAKRS